MFYLRSMQFVLQKLSSEQNIRSEKCRSTSDDVTIEKTGKATEI